MHAADFERLHLPLNIRLLCSAVSFDLDRRVAGRAEIAGSHKRIDPFLNSGLVGRIDGHGASLLVGLHCRARDAGERLVHAFDATVATEMDITEFDGGFGGLSGPARRYEDGDECEDSFHNGYMMLCA